MTNPFQAQAAPPAAPQQPTISDAAAQQFAPQQQAQPQGYDQAAQMAAQGQHPVQQAYAAQAPAQPQQQFAPSPQAPNGELHTQAHGFAPAQPQGLPGQPWTPQQHQQNVPQAYAPPVPQQPAPAPNGFPQGQFPGAPVAQPQGLPQAAFPGAAAQGGGFDASLFGAPSSGGGGLYPKVRDLENRLCLFRVTDRHSRGTAYQDKTKEVINFIANVAVLDGGPLWSSPDVDDPTAPPVLVSETVPYVVVGLTIGQNGMKNRLKADFVRGRVVRMPMGKFEESIKQQFQGMEPWQGLYTWLSQDPNRVHQLPPSSYFWGIAEDTSAEADRLMGVFGSMPNLTRDLML